MANFNWQEEKEISLDEVFIRFKIRFFKDSKIPFHEYVQKVFKDHGYRVI